VQRDRAVGDLTTLSKRRKEMLDYFQKGHHALSARLARSASQSEADITLEKLAVLRGLATALKEGDTTLDEAFPELRPGQGPVSMPQRRTPGLEASKQPLGAADVQHKANYTYIEAVEVALMIIAHDPSAGRARPGHPRRALPADARPVGREHPAPAGRPADSRHPRDAPGFPLPSGMSLCVVSGDTEEEISEGMRRAVRSTGAEVTVVDLTSQPKGRES
jgi:hypothetical protein